MPVFAGDTMKVQFRGTCFGQQIITDLTYRCNVGTGNSPAATLLEAINHITVGGLLDMQTPYLAIMPPQYQLDTVQAQFLNPVRSAYVSVAINQPGTNAGAATVSCDSAAITRRTALAGRKQTSTLKIGPMPDAASAAGFITNAQRVLLGAFGSLTLFVLVLPASTAQFTPTILARDGTHDLRDLASVIIGKTSRVMRRRVVGIGR